MQENTSLALTCDLFQLMKQFPRPKLKQSSIDGLTRREYELLVMLVMSLGDEKKAFTVTEISNLLQITPAGVTHLINPLEDAGYIESLVVNPAARPSGQPAGVLGYNRHWRPAACAAGLFLQEA